MIKLDTKEQIRDKGSDYYYFKLSNAFAVLDSTAKIFQLNSVCVLSSEGEFLYSFVKGDNNKWYKHYAHNVVPVDESKVTEMRVRHPKYLLSVVRVK